jgi:hypothetical protein
VGLSLIGVCLIYFANRKIATATNQLEMNYKTYCFHVLALASLAFIEIVSVDDKSSWWICIGDVVSLLLSSYLCYIVWAQTFLGRLHDYELVTTQCADGTQRMICRLKAQTTPDQERETIEIKEMHSPQN